MVRTMLSKRWKEYTIYYLQNTAETNHLVIPSASQAGHGLSSWCNCSGVDCELILVGESES